MQGTCEHVVVVLLQTLPYSGKLFHVTRTRTFAKQNQTQVHSVEILYSRIVVTRLSLEYLEFRPMFRKPFSKQTTTHRGTRAPIATLSPPLIHLAIETLSTKRATTQRAELTNDMEIRTRYPFCLIPCR